MKMRAKGQEGRRDVQQRTAGEGGKSEKRDKDITREADLGIQALVAETKGKI